MRVSLELKASPFSSNMDPQEGFSCGKVPQHFEHLEIRSAS